MYIQSRQLTERICQIARPVRLTVREVSRDACTGLIQAAAYCRRNGISPGRVLSGR